MASTPVSSVQLCFDRSDASEFYKVAGLYLKPIAKLSITVTLPKLKSGQSISNNEIDQKLRLAIKPVTFSSIKVTKSTMDFLRFEAEISTRVALEGVIQKIDCKGIKLTGFAEVLKIRAAEGKIYFPTRNKWDEFFEDNKNMNLRKAGERPDTVILKGLPKRWFGYPSLPDRPSEQLIERIMSQFGKVRNIDIPTNDALRFKMSEAISGLTPELLDSHSLLFNVFVQFEDYVGFDKCMNALRGNKLMFVKDEKAWTCIVEVDFDRSKHLSDETIKRRKEDRERLVAVEAKDRDRMMREQEERMRQEEKDRQRERENETAALAALHEKREMTMREKEERRRKREQERREKKLRQAGANGHDELLDEKIAKEERKLRVAQRRVESIRLLDELLRRIKIGDRADKKKADGKDMEDDPERGRIVSSMIQSEEDAIGHHRRQVNMAHMGQSRLSSIIAQSDPLENISSRSISNSPPPSAAPSAPPVSQQSYVPPPNAPPPQGPPPMGNVPPMRPMMPQSGFPPNWGPNMHAMPPNLRPPMQQQPPMNFHPNFTNVRPIMNPGGPPPMPPFGAGPNVPPYQQPNFYNNGVGGGYGMGRGGFYENNVRGQFPQRRPYMHYRNVPRDPNAILANKPKENSRSPGKKGRKSRKRSKSRSRSRSRNWSWSTGSRSRSRSHSGSRSRSKSDRKRRSRKSRSRSVDSKKKDDKENEDSKPANSEKGSDRKSRSRSRSKSRHSDSRSKSRDSRSKSRKRSRSGSSSSRSRSHSSKRSRSRSRSKSTGSDRSRRHRSGSSRSGSRSSENRKSKRNRRSRSRSRGGKNNKKSRKERNSVSPNIRESDLDLSSDPDEERLRRHNQNLLNGGQPPFAGPVWHGPGPAPPMVYDGGLPSNRGGRFNGMRGRPHIVRGGRGAGRGAGMWNPPGFDDPPGDPMDGFIDCPPNFQSPPHLRHRGRDIEEHGRPFPRRGRSMERRVHEERPRSPPHAERGFTRYYPSRGRGRSRPYEEAEFDERRLDPRIMRARSRSMERFEEFERGRARMEGRGRGRSRERSFEGERVINYRRASPEREVYRDPRSEYEEGRHGMRVIRDPREEEIRRIKPLMEEDLSGRLYSDRMEASVHDRVSRPGRARGSGREFGIENDRSRSRYSIEREPIGVVARAKNGGASRGRSRDRDGMPRVSPSQTPPEVVARRRNRDLLSPREPRRVRKSVSPTRDSRRRRVSESPRDSRKSRRSATPRGARRGKESSSRDSRVHSESVSPLKKPSRRERSASPKKSKKRKETESSPKSKRKSSTPKGSKRSKRSVSKDSRKQTEKIRAKSSSRERNKKSYNLNTSTESREDHNMKKKSTRGPVLRDKRPASDDSEDSAGKVSKSKKVVARSSVERSSRDTKRDVSVGKKSKGENKKYRSARSQSPKKQSQSSRRSPIKKSSPSPSRSRSPSVETKKRMVAKKRSRTVDISAMYDEQENDSDASTPDVGTSGKLTDRSSDSEGSDSSPKRKKHKKHSKKVKKNKKKKSKKSRK